MKATDDNREGRDRSTAPVSMGLSRIHHPVTVLGHGSRVAVWVQGCSIGCRGCISRDTWPAAAENERVPVEQVLSHIETLGAVDGLTITGGEPFDQPTALEALIAGFRDLHNPDETDVLVYSGYPAVRLRRDHPRLWSMADAYVTGPFVPDRPGDALRGSGNQEVHARSALGELRYAHGATTGKGLQVAVTDGSLWMIGIPRVGDVERMERSLEAHGVVLSQTSWRC